MWRPFGPTTSSTSASISSCRTPSPTPTDSAKSPSLAAPASSPSASSTDWGSPSMLSWLAATDAADTVLMRLVLLSSWTWFRTHHGPNGTGRGGRTAAIKFYELRDNLRCPAVGGLPGGLGVEDCEVDQLRGGLLVGEVPASLDRLADLAVEVLDAVGGVDDPAQVSGEREERGDVGPALAPAVGDHRVARAPFLVEGGQFLLGGVGVDSRVV